MRLKKQTDYALRVLMYLATHSNSTTTIKEIAQYHDISQNHLMKVVQLLGKLGYVKTVRGHNGGIYLGQPAPSIMLGEVLNELGETNELAECFTSNNHCKIEPSCNLKHAFFKANQAFFAVLDQYSLADILVSPAGIEALLYPTKPT